MITLSHADHLLVTIQCYEKLITSNIVYCGNCIEHCSTNCLSMIEEYKLSTYYRYKLNNNQIALGRLPISMN
ncbi:hypothetical protein AAG906_025746 [Vitis piasezkii]